MIVTLCARCTLPRHRACSATCSADFETVPAKVEPIYTTEAVDA